jgi:hypothetical protein
VVAEGVIRILKLIDVTEVIALLGALLGSICCVLMTGFKKRQERGKREAREREARERGKRERQERGARG